MRTQANAKSYEICLGVVDLLITLSYPLWGWSHFPIGIYLGPVGLNHLSGPFICWALLGPFIWALLGPGPCWSHLCGPNRAHSFGPWWTHVTFVWMGTSSIQIYIFPISSYTIRRSYRF